MTNQLARLFLRGSLMNETAKLLSKDEMVAVEALMKEAWEDPNIQSQKTEFYMALARTIGNEYKNMDVGKQDALITFWKAALLVLFHESKQCTNKSCHRHYVTTKTKVDKCTKCGGELVIKWSPKPQIAHDPLKRKKFFQAVMFNYLRQIFRENKPTAIKETRTEEGSAPDVALNLIKVILGRSKDIQYEIQTIDMDQHIVACETGLIPLKALKQIIELKHDLEQHGTQITLDWKTINISSVMEIPPTISCKIIDKVYAKFTSLDSGSNDDTEDGGFRDHYEYKVVSKLGVKEAQRSEYSETLEIVRGRLTTNAQKLFDVYISCPMEYVEQFNTDKFSKPNLAKFLGVSVDEIDDMRENIRLNMLAMDMAPNMGR